MPTIDPNLLGRVSREGTRTPSRQSPARGGGQSVVGLDRLQLGSETVSPDEVVKILVERMTSQIQEALREAKVARAQGLPVEVAPEASAEAVAKRLFDFALGSFKEFEAANPRMSAAEARRLFASLMAEAAGEALNETYNLLHGLKAFVSSELASKMENIREMLVEMLEEFASEGEVDAQPAARRPEAKEPQGFRPKGFARKVVSGRQALFKPSGHAHRQVGWPEPDGTGRLQGLLDVLPSGEQEEAASARGADGIRSASKQPSAGQATRILGDRILANVREALRELGVTSAQGLSVEVSVASTPEAVARRIFEAVMRMFGELDGVEPASRPPVSPEAFSRLVAEAAERGVSDTLGFYRVMKTVLGAEAQANVDKVSSLLAKMMDEFVAEGLKELSPRALDSLLSVTRPPETPPKEPLAGSLPNPESAPPPESAPGLRSPQPAQAYLVPPESTVLAMTKQSLSKKLYTSGEPPAAPLTVSLKVSLGTLIGTLFGIAVVLNAPWEVAHLIIRYGWESLGPAGLFTSVKAAVGDGLLVLALYGMGCALFQDREWILRPKGGGYALLMGAGAAVAFALEWHASMWSRWAPSGLLPFSSLFGVGLMPLVQFMALPLIAAYLTRLWLWRYCPNGAPRHTKALPHL